MTSVCSSVALLRRCQTPFAYVAEKVKPKILIARMPGRRILIMATILASACVMLMWHSIRATAAADEQVLVSHADWRDLPVDGLGHHASQEGKPSAGGAERSRYRSTSFIKETRSNSLLPLPSPGVGHPMGVEETLRYTNAIMNPEDDSFSRLLCPVPSHSRYGYLKSASSSDYIKWDQPQAKRNFFFALNLHQCVLVLPRLLGSVVETMLFLGPENCALSIVEGRSDDGTFQILVNLKEEMERIGVNYYLSSSVVNPLLEGGNRVKALAELRNQVLQPLTDRPEEYGSRSTIVFLNDVSLCTEDLLELIHQRIIQKADMTCAMDWIFSGSTFYDVWVSRAMNGDLFFDIPQNGSWEFSGNLFWNNPEARTSVDAKLPFQVFACWNGATAFTAMPLAFHMVSFRSSYEDECVMGEPTLLCKDFWHNGYNKIAVIPSINIGYSDEESRAVKQRHGYVSDWAWKEQTKIGSDLIEWRSKPPDLVKCVPSWHHPSWVPFNEALAAHNNVSNQFRTSSAFG